MVGSHAPTTYPPRLHMVASLLGKSYALTKVNLAVYSDSGCTQTATSLTVGSLNPGGTATQTVYIKKSSGVKPRNVLYKLAHLSLCPLSHKVIYP